MTLFRSNNQRDLWQDRWCHSCFQPDEAARRVQGKDTVCPIWERAMRTDRKPVEWDRNTRTEEVWRMIKCNSYTAKPPVQKRRGEQQFEDVPLFEVTPYSTEVGFVPVDGWPERPKKDGVDHQ